MTFTLPSNRLTVADTDAIITLIGQYLTDQQIEWRMRASGIRVTGGEIAQVRREFIADQEQARAAS